MDVHSLNAALDRIATGDAEAFSSIVRAYSLLLRSYLATHLHHVDEVDDLAQEAFLAAFRSVSTFRRGDDFGTWLRGIARHKLQNQFRHESRLQSALERFREEIRYAMEGDLETAAGMNSSERIEVLLRCVSRLPERLRRVVRGGLDGQKPSALASTLNTTVSAVYSLHYRANRLLRKCVERELS